MFQVSIPGQTLGLRLNIQKEGAYYTSRVPHFRRTAEPLEEVAVLVGSRERKDCCSW